MRRTILLTTCLTVAACVFSGAAYAQNYIAPNGYRAPDVVVNMDVFGRDAVRPAPLALRPMPADAFHEAAIQEDLMPPMPVMPPAVRPIQPSIQPSAQPPMPAPVMQQPFSAREMASMAPPSSPVPTRAPKAPTRRATADDFAEPEVSDDGRNAVPPPPVAPLRTASTKPVAPAENPARQLLARAREEAQDDALNDMAQADKKEDSVMWDMASAQNAAAAPVSKASDTSSNANRIVFAKNADTLGASEQKILDDIVAQLKSDSTARLQIRAYADGTPETTAQARRLSLARALAVRTYVLNKGIPAPRMDVRALGIGSAAMGDMVGGGAPADRADLVLIR